MSQHPMSTAELAAEVVRIADMGGSSADQCQALYELADKVRPKIGNVLIEQPFIWVYVEGGIADYGGDINLVDVAHVDYDNEGRMPEELKADIRTAERIPDRLAELPRDDPRWLDRAGIIKTLTEDLVEVMGDYLDDNCEECGQKWGDHGERDGRCPTDEVRA